MPALVWDQVGDKGYETGLDRGVLYLPDGSAVAWNGLTSIIEKFNNKSNPVYFDGMKINDLVSVGEFSATMKAFTYPDEFVELEGLSEIKAGMFLGSQNPQLFGLCYRTRIGNDVAGDVAGYKIHVLYNVVALPSDRTYSTISTDPSVVEFEWDIFAIPEEVPGFLPTAQFIINTTELDPWLVEEIEALFYGSDEADGSLMPMAELVEYIGTWYRITITDNGDGTWTADEIRPEFIEYLTADHVQIIEVDAVYLDADTYTISDTVDTP